MPTQYVMRATQISTSKTVYWVVTGAPDNTGSQSGVTLSDLSNITTDYTSNLNSSSTNLGNFTTQIGTRVDTDGYDMLSWTFNENSGSTSFASSGTVSASLGNISGTVTVGRVGLFGNCIDVARTSYVRTSISGSTVNPSSTLFTIHGWIRLRSIQSVSNFGRIISKWFDTTGTPSGAPDSFAVLLYENSTNLYIQTNNGGTNKASAAASNFPVPLNQWCHVGVTFNSGTLKLYLNGNLILTDATFPSSINFNGASGGYWSLGGSTVSASGIDGEIEDWRVSSGIERASSYFRDVYQLGVGYGPNTSSIVSASSILSDGYTNLPVAGAAGRLFLPTGGNTLLRDNGLAWTAYGPIHPITLPPSVSSLTWVNQDPTGEPAAAQNNVNGTGFSLVAFPTGNGATNNRHLLVQAAPSAPYNFTVMMNLTLWPTASALGGIVIADSTSPTTKFIEYVLYFTASTIRAEIAKYTNPTTFSASYTDGAVQPVITPNLIWFRQRDDGTNLTWSYSLDGINFMRLDAPRSRTDFLSTPSYIGVIADNPASKTAGNTTTITYSITNATNTSPIQITTSAAHSLQTGEVVKISGVGGNTAANGVFFVTVINTTSFALNGSTGNSNYTSGGTVTFEPLCSKMNILSWEVTSG